MSTKGLPTPPGFLRLLDARDLLVTERSGRVVPEIEPPANPQRPAGRRRSPKISAASQFRQALFEDQLDLYAWPPEGTKPTKLRGSTFRAVVQANDGTVLTLVYVDRSPEARSLPVRLLGWLPTAELLVDERQFMRWLRRGETRKRTGRPARKDAIEAATALKADGTWSPATHTPGQLHHFLNAPGVLAKPISLSATNRIAVDLGYKPRRKPASERSA
jgi:hypothetical protein